MSQRLMKCQNPNQTQDTNDGYIDCCHIFLAVSANHAACVGLALRNRNILMPDLAFKQYQSSKPVGALRIEKIQYSSRSDNYILTLENNQTFTAQKHHAIYIDIEFRSPSESVSGYLIESSGGEHGYELMSDKEFNKWHEAISNE